MGDPFGDKAVTFAFIFGQSLTLDSTLLGGVSAEGMGLDGVASAFMQLDAQWLGFSEVRDGTGKVVTGYTVTSASGTDWSRAVPEPSAVLLLTPWVLGLFRRRSRRAVIHGEEPIPGVFTCRRKIDGIGLLSGRSVVW